MDKLEARSIRARLIGYPKESLRYYFYFPKNHNMIMSQNIIFFKKKFIQDGSSRRQIGLEERIFEEQWVMEPIEPIQTELIHIAPPPQGSSRIFYPLERYLDIISEKVKKYFL